MTRGAAPHPVQIVQIVRRELRPVVGQTSGRPIPRTDPDASSLPTDDPCDDRTRPGRSSLAGRSSSPDASDDLDACSGPVAACGAPAVGCSLSTGPAWASC